MALSDAERSARAREKRKAGAPAVAYRRPAERRTRPQKWRDAVQTLTDLIEDYQQWRDRLPPPLEGSGMAARLDDVLELRELVEALAAAELPRGFGRD
jgi:hypothetical protein